MVDPVVYLPSFSANELNDGILHDLRTSLYLAHSAGNLDGLTGDIF